MTRAMTIVALTCFLVVGAAATSILGRDSVPMARFELASASVSAVQGPVSTRDARRTGSPLPRCWPLSNPHGPNWCRPTRR